MDFSSGKSIQRLGGFKKILYFIWAALIVSVATDVARSEPEESVFDVGIFAFLGNPEPFLHHRLRIFGLLDFSTVGGEGHLYPDEAYFESSIPVVDKAYLRVVLPPWLSNRPDLFNQREIILTGIIQPEECNRASPCFVLTQIDDASFFDSHESLQNAYPFIELSQSQIRETGLVGILEYFRDPIVKEDVEKIATLFKPDLRDEVVRQLQTPGSALRWNFYSDPTGLPEHLRRIVPSSSWHAIFFPGEKFETRIFSIGPLGFQLGEARVVFYCVKGPDDGDKTWPTSLFGWPSHTAPCMDLTYDGEEWFLPSGLLGFDKEQPIVETNTR
jgi:hypothetical protein